MCNTVGILVFHPCRVGPALRPISPHRNKRTGGNWSVVCLPFFHALERQRVIGIFYSLVVHIDDNKRQHHFFWIDLIYCAKSLYEMSRGVHMRAPLADMRIQFGEETCSHGVRTLLIPVNCFACLIRKPRPVRDSRCKLVRQVYISFAGNNLLNLPKRRFLCAPYRLKSRVEQAHTPEEVLLNWHWALVKE